MHAFGLDIAAVAICLVRKCLFFFIFDSKRKRSCIVCVSVFLSTKVKIGWALQRLITTDESEEGFVNLGLKYPSFRRGSLGASLTFARLGNLN